METSACSGWSRRATEATPPQLWRGVTLSSQNRWGGKLPFSDCFRCVRCLMGLPQTQKPLWHWEARIQPTCQVSKRTGRELGGLRSWGLPVSARASSCLSLYSCPVPIPRGGPYLWYLASVPLWNDDGKLRRQGIHNKPPLLAIRKPNPEPGPVAGPTSDHTPAPFKAGQPVSAPSCALSTRLVSNVTCFRKTPPLQRPPQQRVLAPTSSWTCWTKLQAKIPARAYTSNGSWPRSQQFVGAVYFLRHCGWGHLTLLP